MCVKPQTLVLWNCGFLQQNNENVGDLNFNLGIARACPGLQPPMIDQATRNDATSLTMYTMHTCISDTTGHKK